jgi:hypothetical protein
MSQFNYVGSGNPTNVPAPGSEVANYLDTLNDALWFSTGSGWVPNSLAATKSALLSQTAATQANVLTFSAPKTGMYRIDTYAVQIGATGGTLPSTAVAYTEGDSGATETGLAVQTTGTGTNNGDNKSGSVIINAKGGTNIVVSSASAATLTYTLKARVEFLG